MLNRNQLLFKKRFLSPFKQKFYYLKSLPIGLVTGIRLVRLDESESIAEVPYRWVNKNPFASMYFAVQSMAAELSIAAPVILSLESTNRDIAFIIVELHADFVKKAQSKVVFTCNDYEKINQAVQQLKQPDDTVTVTAKSTGRDIRDDVVATFTFTWSFRLRS